MLHEYREAGIRWDSHLDGTSNLHVDASRIRGSNVVFFADFSDEAEAFRQLAVIYAIPRLHAYSLTIVMPFFPFATQDRVHVQGDIAMARSVARMLEHTPPCHGTGPAKLVIYDIHATQEQFFFGDSIVVDMRELPGEMMTNVGSMEVRVSRIIAVPDAGARSRFGRRVNISITCEKTRHPYDSGRRDIKIIEGDPSGRHVLLIDDLIQTGGTLIAATDKLLEAGALSVSAYATHAILPGKAMQRLRDSMLSEIAVTDTNPRGVARFLSGHLEGSAHTVISMRDLYRNLLKEIEQFQR